VAEETGSGIRPLNFLWERRCRADLLVNRSGDTSGVAAPG